MHRKLATLTVFIVLALASATAQEICNNGIDDDADGLVDLNDPQCECTGTSTGTPQSLIPNPSFEEMLCCPSSYSEMNCATGWVQASDATSDYFNSCNFVASSIPNAGLVPFPDGVGCIGAIILSDYKEYVGSCLLSPMVAGESYTLQMDIAMLETDGFLDPCTATPTDYSPFVLTVYGAPTCGNIPYMGMDCPIAPFSVIGSITYDPLAEWQTLNITFTPTFNVAEIVIGAPCTLPPDYPALATGPLCFPYLLVDNLIINTSSSFDPFEVQLSGNLCNNNAVLNASPVLTGGTWQWYEDGVALVGQTGSSLNLSGLALGGGHYTATFTEANGCVAASIDVQDAEPFNITVNSETICPGATATLTVSGTSGSCSWSPTTGLSSATGLTVQASPAATTNYTVTAIANGCTATAVSTVTVSQNIVIDVNDETTCPGGSVTLTASGATDYTWSPATGLNTTTGPTVIATVTETTTYTVLGTAGDCSGTGQGTVTIDNNVPMSLFASPNPVMVDYPFVQFHGEPSDQTLTWDFGDNTTGTGSTLTHQYMGIDGTYDVLLIVHTDEGCIDSMRVTIVVESGLTFYVPNTFTPDGNEFNNVFQPVFAAGYDPYNYELLIFNRWGEVVFQTEETTAPWDGSYKGSIVPEGQYSWKMVVKSDRSDERHEFKGHVYLLR